VISLAEAKRSNLHLAGGLARRLFLGVSSMIDSLEVEVLYPT